MTTSTAIAAMRRNFAGSDRARRLALASGVLGAAALVSLSLLATAPASVPEVRPEKAWPVSVTEIAPGARSPMFTAYGRVESDSVANVRVDVAAPVAAVHVHEGQLVRAGDLLVTLDARALELTVAERRADLAREQAKLQVLTTERTMLEANAPHYEALNTLAQKQLERHEALFAEGMIARSLLDAAIETASQRAIEYQSHRREQAALPYRLTEQRALIARIEAELARAELDLARCRVTAPFDGPVIAVNVAPGDRSTPGEALVVVAGGAGLEVRAPVPDEYDARLRRHLATGEPVRAVMRGGEITLRLARLSRHVRSGRSGVDAFFRVAGAPPEVLPELGRVVDLTVVLPPEDGVVALPVQSIYENDRVYRVENGRLEAMTVTRIGSSQTPDGEYRVLVRSPELVAGQHIITTQLPRAISGLLVEPAGA